MHIHTVFFWLKEGLDQTALDDFEEGLRFLMGCDGIIDGYWGTPADTHRDVVDRSYHYSITLFFKTLEEQNAYQQDPDHAAFIKRCGDYWERVRVYDVQTGE